MAQLEPWPQLPLAPLLAAGRDQRQQESATLPLPPHLRPTELRASPDFFCERGSDLAPGGLLPPLEQPQSTSRVTRSPWDLRYDSLGQMNQLRESRPLSDVPPYSVEDTGQFRNSGL